MSLPTTPSCSVVTGPSITCSRQSNTKLKLAYTSVPLSTNLEINLDQLTNYLIGESAQTFNIYIRDSGDFFME